MPKQAVNITGLMFHQLKAIRRVDNIGTQPTWLFECTCGVRKPIASSPVRRGNTKSCGCTSVARSSAAKTKHGEAIQGKRTTEYRIWKAMRERCDNPNVDAYPDYGGRGITVCQRWRESYLNFLEDMGRRPSNRHTLDRYPDNDGNYEPSNCRWATWEQQAANRRPPKRTRWSGRDV